MKKNFFNCIFWISAYLRFLAVLLLYALCVAASRPHEGIHGVKKPSRTASPLVPPRIKIENCTKIEKTKSDRWQKYSRQGQMTSLFRRLHDSQLKNFHNGLLSIENKKINGKRRRFSFSNIRRKKRKISLNFPVEKS